MTARTVKGPPNNPRELFQQRYSLNSLEPTYVLDEPDLAIAYGHEALQLGHWAILVFHEVVATRKAIEETSKAVHRTILQHILRQPIWCAPARAVFGHVTGIV